MNRVSISGILPIAGGLILAVSIAACSTAGGSKQNDAAIGCSFNAEKVCQNALTAPVTMSGGFTTSNQSYIQDNSAATTSVVVPIRAPGGSEIDVNCGLKYATKKVIYAYAKPSGAVSGSDQQWFHQTGMCIGTAGTEAPPDIGPQE
ncbi:MAG: hypothetical protein WBE78_19380 [Candidatus Binataceae bacterium]